MKNYKICVYAISKNEEKFVNRWVDAIKDADKIIVLDTGSTDNTVALLEERGVEVHRKIFDPWRFDVARNYSLDLVSEDIDICICLDLDEVMEEGWKEKLIKAWDEDTTRIKYTYNWSFDEYGNPATTFLSNKIHSRQGYIWTHPVHEVLTPLKEEKEKIVSEIVINHYADKEKSRSSYLPLLELSVKENPEDDRNMHYLGREYMYYKKWDKCIETLEKHLNMKKATWKDERCASMRFIGRSYKAKGDIEKAKEWYLKAIDEAPYLREAYVELAYLYYEEENYFMAYDLLKRAFNIKKKSQSYINEEFAWNSFIYDLMSICAFKLEYYDEACENAKKALEKDPNNIRLQLNLEIMENYINN